ncbi:MAG TPA: sigma-70 family RNA polymerase sigma factor [Thermoanaerobaculia bacterium]|nr:sigma-70 family RNA polymerase sigma factor [Thermoanaerobaculia bacterium]
MPEPSTPSADNQALEEIFLSSLGALEGLIRFTCRRQHCDGEEAKDFASYVQLSLIENDYGVLRKFQGRSSLKTYLAVVVQRLFLDYRIQQRGKWRPSVASRRRGVAAVELETLLYREGYSLEEAMQTMTTRCRAATSREALAQLAAVIPPHLPRRRAGEETLAHLPAPEPLVEQVLIQRERKQLEARIRAVLARAIAALPAPDREILAMRFDEGKPIAQIARALRLDPKPLYRRIERLLRELRVACESAGIGRLSRDRLQHREG